MIFRNNTGADIIINEYKKIKNERIKIFPSIRFEYFLSLLKNSDFIIGNSSAGIMEAPYYGVPTLNLGNRQSNRAKLNSIINLKINKINLVRHINKYSKKKFRFKNNLYFGKGNSYKKFIDILNKRNIWKEDSSKQFNEIPIKQNI